MELRSGLNIYCDESSHLARDNHPFMVLGAVTCPVDKAREVAVRLRETKVRGGLTATTELKWNKVSAASVEAYMGVLDYFFDDDDLRFRGVVAQKDGLDHTRFEQDHDTWYFKMYFELLRRVIRPHIANFIYLDVKDTNSAAKVRFLHRVLANASLDFERNVVQGLQAVHSHEVEQVQLADVFSGLLNYRARRLDELETASESKKDLVSRAMQRSGYDLTQSTLLSEDKFNVFFWTPR